MSEKQESGSDWPVILFLCIFLLLTFGHGGIWIGILALVVGVFVLGWNKRHEGPFPTDRNGYKSKKGKPMASMIHIYHNQQQEGPYSENKLREMVANRGLAPITLAWKEGMADWAPLNTILEFNEKEMHTATPPPIPIEHLSNDASAGVTTGPRGVGGWLVFFCVSLTIISPIYYLGSISRDWELAQPAFAQFPSFETAVLWETFGSVVLLIYGFIVGWMIWGGNPRGREIARKYLIISLVGCIGIEFIMIPIMSDMPSDVVMVIVGSASGAVFRQFVYFMIWWFYFKKSKRVKNTYGPE